MAGWRDGIIVQRPQQSSGAPLPDWFSSAASPIDGSIGGYTSAQFA